MRGQIQQLEEKLMEFERELEEEKPDWRSWELICRHLAVNIPLSDEIAAGAKGLDRVKSRIISEIEIL